MISHEDFIKLLRKAKLGDEKAKQEIYSKNEPLIKCIVKRFKGKGVEYDDLYQIASMGLIKAINNFDERFNVKFSTYTVPMVIGEIKRYMRDNGAIKVSRSIKILALKINRFIDEYQLNNDTPPQVEEIAKQFNVTEDEVVFALDSSKIPLSIYEKFDEDEDDRELLDKIPSENPEETLVDKIHLRTIINCLDDREKKIVIMRYFRDKTQSEIAETIGVSQVQISRIENKIINKIKQEFIKTQ